MLKLLKKRAKALDDAKFDKVSKIESKMDKLKDSHFDNLRTPNRFYCTFHKVQASQSLQELGKFTLNDHEVKVKRAKDPSDILWTNLGSSKKWRCVRVLIFAILFPGCILTVVFQTFTTMIDY